MYKINVLSEDSKVLNQKRKETGLYAYNTLAYWLKNESHRLPLQTKKETYKRIPFKPYDKLFYGSGSHTKLTDLTLLRLSSYAASLVEFPDNIVNVDVNYIIRELAANAPHTEKDTFVSVKVPENVRAELCYLKGMLNAISYAEVVHYLAQREIDPLTASPPEEPLPPYTKASLTLSYDSCSLLKDVGNTRSHDGAINWLLDNQCSV